MGLEPGQRWILALAGVLTEVNEGDHALLGGFPRPAGAADAASLLGTWDLHVPDQVAERLAQLLARDDAATLGWELGRAVAVAGWAYVAYLFDAATAWGWMRKAAVKVQATLSSWDAFAESYVAGRDRWRGERRPTTDDAEVRAVVARLRPTWAALPWRTPLARAKPPVREPRVLAVGRTGHRSIAAALHAASDGDRITVAAGRYREPLVFDKSVEVVGVGAVIVEADRGPLVTVDDTSVVLSGLALRTKRAKGQAPAIQASGGFLRVERCTITAAGFGIDLVDDAAEVHLDGSRVVGCASVGVIVERGTLVVRDTTFEGNGTANLQVGGEAGAHLVRAKIIAAHGSGMQLHDEAVVRLHQCEVRGNPEGGIVVRDAAGLTIEACRFRDNDATHLWLGSTGEVTIAGVAIEGGSGTGIQVQGSDATIRGATVARTALACLSVGAGRPTIADSTFSNSGQSGVFVFGGKPVLTGCRIERNRAGGIEVRDTGDPELRDCTIAGNAGDGVLVQAAGHGRFARCTITKSSDAGVRVLAKADPQLARCRIEDNAKEGVVVGQRGKGRFVHCDIHGNALGVFVAEASAPAIRGGRIHGHADDGIFVNEGSLALDDCELFGNELNLRLQRANVTVARCRVHAARSAGVYVGDATKARIEDCDIFANGDAGLEIAERSDPAVLRCHVHDNAGDDVSVHDRGKGRFADGALGGGKGWALRAEGGSVPALSRMKLRAGKKGEVSHDAKSRPVLEGCELGAGKGFAIAALAPRPPLSGSLGAKLVQLDGLLGPDARDAMNDGASEAALARLATVVKPLRDELVTFFRWHDGQSAVTSLHGGDNRTPMSIDEAISEWRFLGAEAKRWKKTWLPLFANGAGDHLCFDLRTGSLVAYWHTDPERAVAYASLEAWADGVIAALATDPRPDRSRSPRSAGRSRRGRGSSSRRS